MKKILLFALMLTAGMNAWAGDYVAYDYLNDVVCDKAYTRIYKEPTLEDPSFAIFMFIKDSGNGKQCVTWGGYENQNEDILPKIYIDGQYFAQPGWEMCWLNNNPDNGVDTWWDTKNDKASIYTKEINGVTWTLRFSDVQRYDSRYYFVKMYFCPSEIEGGSGHTITVKGRLTEYVGENKPSTTNYLDVERDFVFDVPKLITSNPIVVKENTNEKALSFYGNLAAGAEKSTYFGLYVNDGTADGFVPYDQLDSKQELADSTTFSNIEYTIPEKYKNKALRVQMHRDFTGLLGGKVSVCHYYDGFNAVANTVHFQATEPTYTTRGSNQECWEDLETRKIYSDVPFERELNPAKVVTYKKLISNPVTANNGFTLKDAIYDGVQFNWAAETTYGEDDTGTRSVEFTVYGNDVDNARLKWAKNVKEAGNGKFTITVYVNGTRVYSINQDDNKDLAGFFTVPLPGLKTGDVVKFEVKKPGSSVWNNSPTIAACLEYTCSDGGERVIIHHDAVEPTYETVGNMEYWEDDIYCFLNAGCTQKISPELTVTYKKLISNPVTAINGFTLRDAAYGGVQFNWAAETTYGKEDTGTRSVEFTVYGKDVDNARVKWTKNYNAAGYGKFTITVYVNGVSVYSVNQNKGESLGGLFAVPLLDLKTGDVVKFEVNKPNKSDWPDSNPTIAACLEYTSSTKVELIHRDAVEPTFATRGFNKECWEALNAYLFYSDADCTQELNPAEVVTYKKLISNPVVSNDGFTLKDTTYSGVQFDWAAETTYRGYEKGTRSVEFGVYGKDVDNARLKWTKNYKEAGYGKFTITVYVNGLIVYSVSQNTGESLGGLFAVPLLDLKTGDVVKFKVDKPDFSEWRDAKPTITACLEYTSSDGGLNEGEGMLITVNQDPDAPRNYYATFYSSTDVYQVPEGVTAYACAVDGSVLKPTAIEDGIIPAGQGVILRLTTEDNTATKKQIALMQTTATGTWSGANALTGTDEATTLGEKDYALSLGQNGVGFYLWNGKPVGANRAYLTLDGSAAGTKALGFEIED